MQGLENSCRILLVHPPGIRDLPDLLYFGFDTLFMAFQCGIKHATKKEDFLP